MELENLPGHVIHHIMHLLPYKEAAKFSVLSKSLYSSWLSFPALHFNYESIFSDVSHQAFFNIVQKTLLLRDPYLKGFLHSLRLVYKELDIPSDHHYPKVLDLLLNFAIENNVKELNFHLQIREIDEKDPINKCFTVNWNYDSLRPLFSSQFLTVLNLVEVRVPSSVDAFISCPKLEELVLNSCEGFQTINVSSSSSLKKVLISCIRLKEVQILLKGKSLNSFKPEGHEYYDLRQLTLTIGFSEDLKILKLFDATNITDEFNSSLKKLTLDVCCPTMKLDEIVIDAPNLLEFHYTQRLRGFPKITTSAKCSASISLLFLHFLRSNLRDFLCCFNHFKDLSISCREIEDMIFTELPFQPVNVSSLYELRHLKVEARVDPLPCGPNLIKLLKGLLNLVPKPLTITLYSLYTKTTSTLRFNYGKKLERTILKVGDCCYKVPIKCWRHYEVEIEFKGFDESEREHLNKFFASKLSCYER